MATDIKMPQLGMIMTEGTLARWFKSPGEAVQQGEPLAEITTEKITYELESPETGVFHPVVGEGDVVPVEELIAHILAEGEPAPEAPKPEAVPPATAGTARAVSAAGSQAPAPEGVRAAPSARKLAAQLDIDIAQVPPARPGGRIVEADVRAFAEKMKSGEAGPAPSGFPKPSKVMPFSGIRRAIAESMRRSVASTAQLSFHIDVDMTEASARRRELSKKSEVTLSIADVLLKACAEALVRHPQLNTILVDGKVHFFDEVNIGLAVALNEGLVVPVIKDVQDKGLEELARERDQLVTKAREGRLLPDDMAGGTFTLTVLGTVDGFTPILNPGQSAILGMGRVAKKPVVLGDQIVIREMATLSLTVDHQVVDGAPAPGFLRRLKQVLERPGALF